MGDDWQPLRVYPVMPVQILAGIAGTMLRGYTMILKRFKYILLTIVLLSVFPNASWATTFLNPFPDFLEDDIEDNGLFQHGNQAFSIEFFDFSDRPPLPPPGSEFGFYYAGDSDTLIPIFSVDDVTPVPITNGQQALVDFSIGRVFDIDAGGSDPFTPQGDTNIGFYLKLPTIPLTLFSQAILNPGGQDLAGTFPFIQDSQTIAIAFGTPDLGFLSLHSIQPLAPVPLPGAAGLWLLGIAGLALFRRRLARASM